MVIDLLFLLLVASIVHLIRSFHSLFLINHHLTLLTQKGLGFEVKNCILGGIKGVAALSGNVGCNVLDGALLFDMFEDPLVDKLIDGVS